MPQSPREVFEQLPSRVDAATTRGTTGSYRFDIQGAGKWHIDVNDGEVNVTESDADADCVISTSEETFMRIVRREQSPVTAYMTGKLKVKGDMGAAMKLQKLF